MEYNEIRGLLEDLVKAWPGGEHHLLVVARYYLATHCEFCGVSLVGQARQEHPPRCRVCIASIEAKRKAAEASAISPLSLAVVPPSVELWLERWPTKVRPFVTQRWGEPAVQQLLEAVGAAGLLLPILTEDGRAAILDQRRRVLANVQVMEALVKATRSGVSFRFLAALLFGATPGSVSDEISKAIGSAILVSNGLVEGEGVS